MVVGHSTGGLIIRRFAAAHPRAVAGMVEVDAIAEGVQTLLGPDWPAYDELLVAVPPALASYSELEAIDFNASFAQIRQADRRRPLRPMPLVVLSHGRPFALPDDVPPGFGPALERAWSGTQDQLARLVPGAQHVVAMRSGHDIELDQPALVRAAVKR